MSDHTDNRYPSQDERYPSQVDLFHQVERLRGQIDDMGLYVAVLLEEWRKVETSSSARLLGRMWPDLVQAMYALEVAAFRVDAERDL